MLLYHGSNVMFEKFEIKKGADYLVEGDGIYMCDTKNIPSKYGEIIYEVEVDKLDILDFTKKKTIKTFLKNLEKDIHFKFLSFFQEEEFIENIITGEGSISRGYEDIINSLDSNEKFYLINQSIITYEEDCILGLLKKKYLEKLNKVIKYYDKNLKSNIYIAKDIKKIRIV